VHGDLPAVSAAGAGLRARLSKRFGTLTTKVVAPAAKDRQIVTKTTVAGSSVVSAQPQQVVLLVFLDQVTQTKADPKSRVDGARVRVTLARAGDQWLVSALTPV
jgi:Mce-associated membrane protein